MSYLLEILGRSLPDSLWPVFQDNLQGRPANATKRVAPATAAGQRCSEHILAGVAALESGAGGQARVHFENAVHLRDRSPAAMIGMACALDMLAQPQRAQRYLRLAKQRQPEDGRILYGLGLLEERSNRPERARTYYQHSIYFQPQQKAARHRLMALAFANGEYEAAAQQAEALAAQYPLDLPAWTRLGGLYLLVNEPGRAANAFEEALKLLADNWRSPAGKADHHEEAGESDQAIAELERTLADDERYADLHVRLADLYARQGRSDEALEAYRQALRINPFYLEATAKLAAAFIRLGRRREGAIWLGRAIEVSETLLTTYVGLALAQARCGRKADCSQTIEMARGIASNSPVLMAEIARLHATAVSAGAEPADGADRDSSEARYDRQRLLSQAIQIHLAWLTQHEDDAGAWMRLGMLLEADRQAEFAAEAYEKSVQTYGACTPALIRLGLARATPETLMQGPLRKAFWPDDIRLQTHYGLAMLFSQVQRFELTAEQFGETLDQGQQTCFWRNVALALEQMTMLNMPKCLWQSLCEISGQREEAFAFGASSRPEHGEE